MEGYVTNLVENTFKNYDLEKAKRIVVERILFYENKILQLEEKLEKLSDKYEI